MRKLCWAWLGIVAFGSVAGMAGRIYAQPTGYAKPEECAACHQEIAAKYRNTGMARSFYRPSPANLVEDFTKNNTSYHKDSDSYFSMSQRDGKVYQRRFQKSTGGEEINVVEKPVDYIMGSGNHARTYLSRTGNNLLLELPLGWYSEKGGYWAMNPGYDRPDHEGFRRTITYDCMFCHNGYPEIPAQPVYQAEPVYSGVLPEGIDCQRCHGPGQKHIDLGKAGRAKQAEIRSSIVNPSKLTAERQMEVCMQCHLETTSFPLPNAIQRYERGPFSYRPGEPLSDFILAFDHAPGSGREDKFEIVSAAYRLRKSACFLQSKGKMSCTTCHNPHDIPRGEDAMHHYTSACKQCHGDVLKSLVAAGKHTADGDCTGCHMPKRRTEDVVHVAVTDHYIQRRRPVGDLLADIPERHEAEGAYQGAVVPYYPPAPPKTPETALYVAIAQVIQKSNLKAGIAQLTAAIQRYAPQRAEYYFQLAEALSGSGKTAEAVPFYVEAVRRNPKFVFGLQQLAFLLRNSGRFTEAEKYLQQAVSVAPGDAATWRDLGLNYQAQEKISEAVAALQKATEIDPDMAEARNNLGVIWAGSGEPLKSEAAFREAIRLEPAYGDARYNYAMLLGQNRRFDEAQEQLEASLRANPNLADAHELLADLLLAKRQGPAALAHFREAVRIKPDFGRAQLGLGLALAAAGDIAGAIPHLQKASTDADSSVREEALQTLRQLGK